MLEALTAIVNFCWLVAVVWYLSSLAVKKWGSRPARRRSTPSPAPKHFDCRCAIAPPPPSVSQMNCWVMVGSEKHAFFIVPRDARAWGQPADGAQN